MSDDTAQGHLKRFSMYLKVGIWAIVLFVLLGGTSFAQNANIGETLLGLSAGYASHYFGNPSEVGLRIADKARFYAGGTPDGKAAYVLDYSQTYDKNAKTCSFDKLHPCNQFAVVVMLKTMADVHFTNRLAYDQLDYVRSSPCYSTFTYKSEAEMLPGDLIYQDHMAGRPHGHVAIFIGGNDPRGHWAQASIGDNGHAPRIGGINDDMTVVARLKNGPCL